MHISGENLQTIYIVMKVEDEYGTKRIIWLKFYLKIILKALLS